MTQNSKQIETSVIGETIRTLRVKNNLTQEELADRVGYSVRNLRRIETYGTSSIDVVNLFADEFKVSAIEILDGSLLFLLFIIPYKIKKSLRNEH